MYPDFAEMEGSIRSYDKETLIKMKERIRTICDHTALAHGCKAEIELNDLEPPVCNHKQQTDHVIRLAKKFIGVENFSQDGLPLPASEDFAYFLQEKPGCMFMLVSMKMGKPLMNLHTSDYDFNDNILPTGSYFFTRIVEDRLGVSFLGK